MTEEQANLIITALRNGKQMITRFQEQEWGIVYRQEQGDFCIWRNLYPHEGQSDQMVDEISLSSFIQQYDYNVLVRRLR